MEIHTTNYTRRPDKSTHRLKIDHERTEDFTVGKDGASGGIVFQGRNKEFIFDIKLSQQETELLVKLLIKK